MYDCLGPFASVLESLILLLPEGLRRSECFNYKAESHEGDAKTAIAGGQPQENGMHDSHCSEDGCRAARTSPLMLLAAPHPYLLQ